jgi:rhodanese-related sulfurtransferase
MTTASSQPPLNQIRVQDLARRLAEGTQALQLIDVREPEEVAIARIEGFEVLPLSQYSQWAETIDTRFDPQTETLVLCHHGVRSAQMCQWLQRQGFTNVKNIVGGIHAYAQLVDASIPQY